MPGYPTKKLLFGGPDTRTKAAMVVAKVKRRAQRMRSGGPSQYGRVWWS